MVVATPQPDSLGSALADMLRHPVRTLLDAWSWKAAAVSAVMRGGIFLSTNLHAGAGSALQAMVVEAVFAVFASGTLGAATQRLRNAQPLWANMLVIWLGMPGLMLAAEFTVHHLAGTPHLRTGLTASFVCAALASGFTWYAMHRGVLLAGAHSTSLRHDLRTLPAVVLDFALAPARAVRGTVNSE